MFQLQFVDYLWKISDKGFSPSHKR